MKNGEDSFNRSDFSIENNTASYCDYSHENYSRKYSVQSDTVTYEWSETVKKLGHIPVVYNHDQKHYDALVQKSNLSYENPKNAKLQKIKI